LSRAGGVGRRWKRRRGRGGTGFVLVHRSNCETSTVKDGEDLGFWIMSTVDEVGRDDVLNSATRRECLS